MNQKVEDRLAPPGVTTGEGGEAPRGGTAPGPEWHPEGVAEGPAPHAHDPYAANPYADDPYVGDSGEDAARARSLLDDLTALIEDGRTYFEAERAFQQTRAAFAFDRLKRMAMLGSAAVLVAFVALIGLVVGLIIALTPHLTAWGATALVVGVLLLAALLCVRAAMKRLRELKASFAPSPNASSDEPPTERVGP